MAGSFSTSTFRGLHARMWEVVWGSTHRLQQNKAYHLVTPPGSKLCSMRRSANIDESQAVLDAFARSLNRRFHDGIDGVSTNFCKYERPCVPVRGTVRQTTTCFTVGWRSLNFPLALVVLSSALFPWASLRGRLGHGSGKVTWKSSILSLLYFKECFMIAN